MLFATNTSMYLGFSTTSFQICIAIVVLDQHLPFKTNNM